MLKIVKTGAGFPADMYLFKINNGNTTMCQIYSELTVKTPERILRRRSGVFIVNFEGISYLVLMFPSLTLNK